MWNSFATRYARVCVLFNEEERFVQCRWESHVRMDEIFSLEDEENLFASSLIVLQLSHLDLRSQMFKRIDLETCVSKGSRPFCLNRIRPVYKYCFHLTNIEAYTSLQMKRNLTLVKRERDWVDYWAQLSCLDFSIVTCVKIWSCINIVV